MKAHGVSRLNLDETGRHSDTLTEHTFVTSLSAKFVRCIVRQLAGYSTDLQRQMRSIGLESLRSIRLKMIRLRATEQAVKTEIIGTKDGEYAYQWATIQLVGNAVPIVLDARPVRKGDSRLEIVRDLLDSAQEQVLVDNVLMDREFDSQHILEEIDQRGLRYVVPKRMQTSEQAQARRLLQWDQDRYVTNRNLLLNDDERHETTLVYRRRNNSNCTDYRQYSVFMTNGDPESVARVWISVGDREWLQERQTVHGRHNLEEFRPSILLLCIRVLAVLDLANS